MLGVNAPATKELQSKHNKIARRTHCMLHQGRLVMFRESLVYPLSNLKKLEITWPDSAIICFERVTSHFDKLYERLPTRDIIIHRGFPVLWIYARTYTKRAIQGNLDCRSVLHPKSTNGQPPTFHCVTSRLSLHLFVGMDFYLLEAN